MVGETKNCISMIHDVIPPDIVYLPFGYIIKTLICVMEFVLRIIVVLTIADVVLGLGSANEIRRDNIKSSRIGWSPTQNDAYIW